METTYFTCTLGQAASHQQGKSYNTINEFIQHKSQSAPDTPVVGFYEVEGHSLGLPQWKAHVLKNKDIHNGTIQVAKTLSDRLNADRGQTVALLCPSSADFLFTWLALIWLGHPALLIAPQCSPSAVAQLCKSCHVQYLICDEIYEDLATKASAEAINLDSYALIKLLLPSTGENIFEQINRMPNKSDLRHANTTENDVAYLHHTSGTSSGTPNPIPQTHRGAIGVLPILNGGNHASFTTTPLYHGGIADLFRAWTSDALIWLFPGKELPITAANVCKCLETASLSQSDGAVARVKYFSSVPYVLQMMAEQSDGLRHLQKLDIVGVGGAALPVEVGDSLVKNKVNLISRFGSAECGFLMSSHRKYATDSEWQYLRSSPGETPLTFEPRENDLAELVILKDWPHMAKRNRDDGSYATADLFAPHPTIPDAWQYHSRADSQLTLITGKKFDPAPLEDAIRAAASSILDDVLIFGNGKPYPGVLLLRSTSVCDIGDTELIDRVGPLIEKMNRESQGHARIPRNMLIPMPYQESKLAKSSKGTILRRNAEERFAKEIDTAYDIVLPHENGNGVIPDSKVQAAIHDIVTMVAGESSGREVDEGDLTDETDLFNYGIDSVASIRIRHAMSKLVPDGASLPLTMVQDAGTISRLSDRVLQLRAGKSLDDLQNRAKDDEEQHQLMLDLVKEYSSFTDQSPSMLSSESSPRALLQNGDHGIQVLLTGPTGSLGAHLLSQLISNPSISKVHLLIRGASPTACRERVMKALSTRRLPIPVDFDSKVTIYSCKLSDSSLGLSPKDYENLAADVDVIVHLAWSVNFLLPLRSFATTHLAGVRNLINLSLSSHSKRQSPPRFIFCSSVAAVSNYTTTQSTHPSSSSSIVPEHILSDPSAAGPTGYARSKWVAEQICAHANSNTHLKGRVSVARVGQLSGATDSGVWSATEAYPLMLSSLKVTDVLPDLDHARKQQGNREGEVLGWLPVDTAARAFVEEILLNEKSDRKPNSKSTSNSTDIAALAIHHVLNPSTEVTWSHLLETLHKHENFRTVIVEEWLTRLDALQSKDSNDANHPALKLLGFWRDAYTMKKSEKLEDRDHDKTAINTANEATSEKQARFEMEKTYTHMPVLRESKGVMSEEYILKSWTWIKENV